MTWLAVVSCADSGELHTLAVDPATGQLERRQVLAPGGSLMPIALHPCLPRLYVARRSDPLAVVTLAVDAAGRLEVIAEAPLPASMAYLSPDRTGRWLMSASYGGDCVAIGPIDGEGRAQAAGAPLPTGRHAHSIVADPANRYVYAAALGAHCLHRYVLDASAGTLAPTDPPTVPVRPGAGPRHLVFNGEGTRLYLLNELDASLDVFACEPATGGLRSLQQASVLPPGTPGEPWAAELRLSCDGRWLLATERRSSTLSVFAVAADGSITGCARQAVEATPRGMQLTPDARHVLVAGQASHHVASLAIDPSTGALTPCDRIEVGLNPNWIEFLRLPS